MAVKRLDRRHADRFKLPDNAPRDGRFSHGYSSGKRRIDKAEIYDVSYAGVAFRISADKAPEIGEMIAVEFRLPNLPQIAWYAQVVRVELEHILTENDQHIPILKIGATFLDLPQLRRKQLESAVEKLLSQVHVDQTERITILTEALRVRRSHEISYWRFVRAFLILSVSIAIAYLALSYIQGIGSRELRGSGPPAWEHKDRLPYE